MTKEQLIEFIDKNIPEGDLVGFRTSKDDVYQIVGIDDDENIGLWNILLRKLDEYECPFEAAIENSHMWEKSLTSEINWK